MRMGIGKGKGNGKDNGKLCRHNATEEKMAGVSDAAEHAVPADNFNHGQAEGGVRSVLLMDEKKMEAFCTARFRGL